MTDLVELDIAYFISIHGMDWLHSYYASVNYRTRVIKFQFLCESPLEWKSSASMHIVSFIYNYKARKIISEDGIYYLDEIKNSKSETISL